MMQSPSSQKVGLKKGPWTPEEDQKLSSYIQQHGDGSWSSLPAKAGLHRCGKSCRIRWINYLRPDIKRGKFSLQEEQTIIQLHALLGNRWSAIAAHLPKRTDNEIKNYWNTQLKKRLSKMGIDPATHKPKTDAHGSTIGNPKDAANLSHMAQWERARLEAEARLVRETKQVSNPPQAPPQRVHDKNPGVTKPPCLDILKAWQRVVGGLFSFNINNLESTTSTLPILSAGLNDSFVDAAELKESFEGLNEILGYTPEDAWFQDMNMEENTMEFEGYSDTLMVCKSVDHQNQRSSSMEARDDTAGTSYEDKEQREERSPVSSQACKDLYLESSPNKFRSCNYVSGFGFK